jgi:hypothetical protein
MDPRRLAVGAAAGTAATVAMTGWMLAGQVISRHGEQPPKRLVRSVGQRAGRRPCKLGPATVLVSGVADLGFGASCGALFVGIAGRPSATRGILFALAVWATSYAGWIPALGLMPPPHRDQPGRAWTVMTAHIVYGAVLGGGLAAADRARGT